ncbi:MAG: cobalt ABC transporter ATP-binding protein [Bacillaceae bacterium G1]|nr:MAG: cobalt ABC transporter ATP-binding protein [Bacillaceae bacterium G1]
MSPWLLEMDNVHFTYPGAARPALNGLSLTIPEGKKCVVLGRNGCGKSTLLLHANGIYRPQRGVVKWRGEPLVYHHRGLAHLRQKVGLVFQDPEHQLVATTVEEDIAFGLCNAGLPEAAVRRRVGEILERFDLNGLARTPLHHLSLGQKKWVALAGVMAVEPELLLLDEPTAALDPYHARRLLAELDRLHADGTTVMMATHDMDVALAWGEWIYVVDDGRLVLEGTPEQVFSRRDVLTKLGLGVPILAEVWHILQELEGKKLSVADREIPRNVAELRRRLKGR